jgi:hypothetical protein
MILQNALGYKPLSTLLMALCTSSFWLETPRKPYLSCMGANIRNVNEQVAQQGQAWNGFCRMEISQLLKR